MYKEDLALNNLQWLICHKARPNHLSWLFLETVSSVLAELMNVIFGGQPMLACPYVGVHKRMSLMSLSLLHQQWPACFSHLTFVRWEVSGCTAAVV